MVGVKKRSIESLSNRFVGSHLMMLIVKIWPSFLTRLVLSRSLRYKVSVFLFY